MIDNFLPVLLLGFALGIKHAFDTDHVVAVSTLVLAHKNPWRSALLGAFWGLGHTTTLFLTGFTVLLFKISIPVKAGLFLELLVGVMLIILGVLTLIKKRGSYHAHEHKHGHNIHAHFHEEHEFKKSHSHKKSYTIGIVHGLAGSGALMLLVLSTVKSTVQGLYYILIFGIGSIGAMTIISFTLSLPYLLAFKKFPGLIKYVNNLAGILSLIFGMGIIYEILILGNLLS
ncbi:hypothetical protein A2W14_04060 [Candidatus Gottesmanbacteria bacterium RBG_16_37_8]|uniref:Urease accessory protein UreH-like transmembrane domain-containing protein n=1 Tax=Candidatus Gottesmanbacteria bacterium RBG_16_37_8 TaxID=1798371 RepID=A0A1F5YTX5_9BACT|nr:MAG: hypothetical protein A2W14_04060 [Candidatus Gottesmanbacteria bacterium RBG_16_37_8]